MPEEVGRLQEDEEKRAAKKRQAHGKTAPGKTLPTRGGEASGGGEAVDRAGEAVGVSGGGGAGEHRQHHRHADHHDIQGRVLTSRDLSEAERGGGPGCRGAPRSIEYPYRSPNPPSHGGKERDSPSIFFLDREARFMNGPSS